MKRRKTKSKRTRGDSIFSKTNRLNFEETPLNTFTPEQILDAVLKSIPKQIRISKQEILKNPVNRVTSHERSIQLMKLGFFQLRNFFDASIQKLESLIEEFYQDKRVMAITEGGNDLQFFTKILMWKDISEVDLWKCLNDIMSEFKEMIHESIKEAKNDDIKEVIKFKKKTKLDVKMLGERGQRILNAIGDYTGKWEKEKKSEKRKLKKKFGKLGKENQLYIRKETAKKLVFEDDRVLMKNKTEKSTQTHLSIVGLYNSVTVANEKKKIRQEENAQKQMFDARQLIIKKVREEKPIFGINFWDAFNVKKWNFHQRCKNIF